MRFLRLWPYLLGFIAIAIVSPSLVLSVESAACVYTNPASMEFMTNWLLCGSFPVKAATPEASLERKRNSRGVTALDDKIYRAAFDFDYLVEAGGERAICPHEGMNVTLQGETYTWKYYDDTGKVYDLRRLFNPSEDVVVYAYAEIDVQEAKKVKLALGSDDGFKLFLNGDMVFTVFTGRPLEFDENIIELNLNQGVNRLLLKVQNMTLDYAFACRWIEMKDFKAFDFKKRNRNSVGFFVKLFSGFFRND